MHPQQAVADAFDFREQISDELKKVKAKSILECQIFQVLTD